MAFYALCVYCPQWSSGPRGSTVGPGSADVDHPLHFSPLQICVLAYQTWQPVSVITLCFKGPADHLNLLNHDFLFPFLCCSLWNLFYVSVLFYLRGLPELWCTELSDSKHHIMIWNLMYSHDSCPQTKWTIQTCAIELNAQSWADILGTYFNQNYTPLRQVCFLIC